MSWDVHDKTVLVTGATSGIGFEASVELARGGARVVMVGRDAGRTEAARLRATERSGSREITQLLCDFASQRQIRRLASEVLERCEQLHVLVNNAGGVHKRRELTEDGIERTFAVNHLGYFLLTALLRERLVASAPARVVTVASIGHRGGSLDFEDLGFERGGYSIMKAYARSKLANVLFGAELARRLAGTGVTSNSLHPGSVDTNIWSGAPAWAKPLIFLVFRWRFISAEQGGRRIVELACDPALDGVTGAYFESGRRVEPAPLARDPPLARRLWEASERLSGLATG
jgi:NAD(P)-dependent dehydrogenase (short-subunit alcohol dehydrogenase family)